MKRLDTLRKHARSRAHFLTAALLACAEGRADEAIGSPVCSNDGKGIRLGKTTLGEQLEDEDGEIVAALTDGTERVLGTPAREYVAVAGTRGTALAKELTKLQADVGLNLSEFVEDFLDTVAFQCFKDDCGAPETVLIVLVRRPSGHEHAHHDRDRHDAGLRRTSKKLCELDRSAGTGMRQQPMSSRRPNTSMARGT